MTPHNKIQIAFIAQIFILCSISSNANSIIIPGSTHHIVQNYTCASKNIQLDLQFTSNNGNIKFYADDTCDFISHYANLSITTGVNSFNKTMCGLVSNNTICFSFYNVNFIQSTVVKYSIKIDCINIITDETKMTPFMAIFLFVVSFILTNIAILYIYVSQIEYQYLIYDT